METARPTDERVCYERRNLYALAERTGDTVEFYEELLQAMLEEDRIELFPAVIAKSRGLTVGEVWALLLGHPIQ